MHVILFLGLAFLNFQYVESNFDETSSSVHNFDRVFSNSFNLSTLEGVQLSVISLDEINYKHRMQMRTFKNGSVEFVSGMSYELLLALQHSLKFSYKPLKGFGWIGSRNGSITGMVADVNNGKADLSISQASMVMLPAFDYITFLLPTSTGKLTAIFRQPEASDGRDIVMTTFSLQSWLGWTVVWITICIALVIIHFSLKKMSTNESEKCGLIDRDLIFWCLSTSTCQGWYQQPKGSTSIRTVFVTAMGFTYLNNVFFSASLTSNLASETVPIKTFADLVNKQFDIYGDRRLPVVRDLITKIYSDRKHIKLLWKSKKIKHYFIYVDASADKIQRSRAAFVTFDAAAKSAFHTKRNTSRYFCEKISSVDLSSKAFPNAMFVQKGSYLKEIFNRKILLTIERGITFRLNSQFESKTIVKCPIIYNNYRGGLSFRDVSSSFLFIFCGVFVCTTAVLLENVCEYLKLRVFLMHDQSHL